ncbi:hypothetical protein pb186bvf_018946 [Paramecium bursaria]
MYDSNIFNDIKFLDCLLFILDLQYGSYDLDHAYGRHILYKSALIFNYNWDRDRFTLNCNVPEGRNNIFHSQYLLRKYIQRKFIQDEYIDGLIIILFLI